MKANESLDSLESLGRMMVIRSAGVALAVLIVLTAALLAGAPAAAKEASKKGKESKTLQTQETRKTLQTQERRVRETSSTGLQPAPNELLRRDARGRAAREASSAVRLPEPSPSTGTGGREDSSTASSPKPQDPKAQDPSSRAEAARSSRAQTLLGEGSLASEGPESVLDATRSDPARSAAPPLRTGDAGDPVDPVGDPLADAAEVGSPVPTARELQDGARAAKGDRTSQAGTVFRVDLVNQEPYVVRQTPPEPEDDAPASNDTNTSNACEEDANNDGICDEDEQAAEQAESDATQDCENVDENGWCYDKGDDTTTRPDPGFGGEYTTRLSEEELAERMEERKAGVTDPAEDELALPDPDALKTREQVIREQAGNLINPGTGETGALPVGDGSVGATPSPSPCELAAAGGAPEGECSRGDGLQQ